LRAWLPLLLHWSQLLSRWRLLLSDYPAPQLHCLPQRMHC
jgi:hypothetical protein